MSNFRITTNGLYRNYRSNLSKNNQKLNDAMTTVQTNRKFNSYADDPSEASKAWRLRRSYWRTGDQIDNTQFAISKYESAYAAMASIVDGDAGNGEYGLNGILSALRGVSDTSGSGRVTLGRDLVQTAENMVAVMNTKYGDDFVFAGADGENVPFSWDDSGHLLYRGVNVNVEKPRSPAEFGLDKTTLQAYGMSTRGLGKEDYDETLLKAENAVMDKPLDKKDFINSQEFAKYQGANDDEKYAAYQTAYMARLDERADNGTGPKNVDSFEKAQDLYKKLFAFQNYAAEYGANNGGYEKGIEDYEKIDKLANEATYLDIGIGLKESRRGEVISGSAFNTAISGLNFLGYGKDQNLVQIVRELGEIFSRADRDSGAYSEEHPEDEERANELITKLHDAINYSQEQHTKLDADAKYLRTNLTQLETNKAQLDEQIVNTEDMKMADSITQMTWAKYCYDAALRIGTEILSQSLLDYMG